MDPITTRNQYMKEFRDDETGTTSKKQAEALRYAHEIRRFEIDLYWKRAAYFWTFIAAAFGAFFLLEKDGNAPGNSSFLLSCLGLVFSVAWYLANRGSKYWQDNWEQHVDLLEDEITGPLYKLNADNPEGYSLFRRPLDAYPVSVSRINQILSLFVIAIWILLLVRSLLALGHLTLILALAVTGVTLWMLLAKTTTKRTGEDFSLRMLIRRRGITPEQSA